MELSAELNAKIIEFLESLPNMQDSPGQQSFINSASLDEEEWKHNQ
jgi:hypothetical protein